MKIEKISEYEIEITKDAPIEEPTVIKYERSFIEQQIKNIQEQKDRDNALRDAELKECQDILTEMDKLKIVIKPESVEINSNIV